jgi:hypothetical protein
MRCSVFVVVAAAVCALAVGAAAKVCWEECGKTTVAVT